jgi:hypothetical protein
MQRYSSESPAWRGSRRNAGRWRALRERSPSASVDAVVIASGRGLATADDLGKKQRLMKITALEKGGIGWDNTRHRTTGATGHPKGSTLYDLGVHATVDLSSSILRFQRGDMTRSSPSPSNRVGTAHPQRTRL